MGFIEELRIKKLQEEERQSLMRKDEEEKARKHREAMKVEDQTENERLESLRLAKEQFDQSGLADVIDEVRKLDRGVGELEDMTKKHPLDRDWFYWHILNLSGHKGIDIKTRKDGTITFSGGNDWKGVNVKKKKNFLGISYTKIEKKTQSTTLEISVAKKDWINNRGNLEEALGRVFNNPRQFIYYDPSVMRANDQSYGATN